MEDQLFFCFSIPVNGIFGKIGNLKILFLLGGSTDQSVYKPFAATLEIKYGIKSKKVQDTLAD